MTLEVRIEGATHFVGADVGTWRIVRNDPVRGEPLRHADRLVVVEPGSRVRAAATWILRGVPSYERYVRRAEQRELLARSPELGRLHATSAALIPISKSTAWWRLAQDERREIFEERSRHIATGLKYLPAVARRLYHGRDLGEPFDFLTWFEFAPQDAVAFEELVAMLRETEEWAFVEREIDIRLTKA